MYFDVAGKIKIALHAAVLNENQIFIKNIKDVIQDIKIKIIFMQTQSMFKAN